MEFEDEEFELELMQAFEEVITQKKEEPKGCSHKWIEIGRSPLTNYVWINCEKCDMPIEKYENDVEF